MKCKLQNGEQFTIYKLPFKQIIEAKVAGKKIQYQRTPEGFNKINDENHENEEEIISLIEQHYTLGRRYVKPRYNR